jgi:hypothetical protein
MAKLRRRLATTALLASGALLLLPAAGQAALVFGSGLQEQPNEPDCETFLQTGCTVVANVEIPQNGTILEAGSPIDGVITKFRIWAKVEEPTTVTFRVANLSAPLVGEAHPISATASAAGTGPTVPLHRTVEEEEVSDAPIIQEFAGRLPVKKGQHLGVNGPSTLIATHNSNGSKFSYEFGPPLADGGLERTSTAFLGELLVQATVEPDVDQDGFGDETQDACPSQASTQGPCADLTNPAITGFRVRKGKAFYTLSEAATVRFRLTMKSGHRFKAVGKPFKGSGNMGANHRALPHARRLRPGAYRLKLTATDAAGNAATKTTAFRIRR